MVQEFKEFDKIYSSAKGTFLAYEDAAQIHVKAQEVRESRKCFRGASDVKIYTNDVIRQCVYFAEGAGEWQRFRVSLKGFDTAMKLARLEFRWYYFASTEYEEIEHVRIDNYLGALRRGGQLDQNYRIVK